MDARKLNKTEINHDSRAPFLPRLTALISRPAGILKPIAILIFVISIPVQAYPQSSGFFAVKRIIEIVQKRFKLNKKELADISPLIKQENIDVLSIYVRYGGDEPEYSAALWQEIISRRIEFENRVDIKLNNRQKVALRAARTALEDRVLGSVVDDFVFSLGQFLELNSFETEAVQNILCSEYKRKHRLILKELARRSLLERELETISEETEECLKNILSADQFRDYKSLSAPVDFLVGAP